MQTFLLIFRLRGPWGKFSGYGDQGLDHDKFHQTFLTLLINFTSSRFWSSIQLPGILLRFFTTTFTIVFKSDEEDFSIWDIMNVIADVLFAIDFVAAVIHRHIWSDGRKRTLNDKSSKIRRMLWKNKTYQPRKIWTMVLDAISLLPLEFLRTSMEFHSPGHIIVHLLPTLRINRILYYVVYSSNNVVTKSSGIIFLVSKKGLITLCVTHSIACVWYLVTQGDKDFERKIQFLKFDHGSPFEWYLVSCYFITSAFTNIGFGDIHPMNVVQRVVVILACIVGYIIINGYLIGVLSSVLSEKARKLTNLRFRLSLIQSDLAKKKVPYSVSKKILKYYYSLWISRRGVGADNATLSELPRSLSTQVYFDIFASALNSSLLFKTCDEFSKRSISTVMSVNLYMSGDVILKRGEINSKMIYVRKGTVQIMSYQDDETQIMTFGAGSIFGQCALLLSIAVKSEVHAATFCEIHSLRRRDLFYVLMDYPKAVDIIRSVHKNLLLNMLADKYEPATQNVKIKAENLLSIHTFYKEPLESSKLARDDICIVTSFPYIFMPDTLFLKVWDFFLGIVIGMISLYYPYAAAFTRKYPQDHEALIILVDILYLVDLIFSFSTAVNKENILMTTFREIAVQRFTSLSTYLDIIATLPIHYFLDLVLTDQYARIKPLVLCIKCFKIYKIPLLFRKAEHNVTWTMINFLRIIKYILYFVYGSYALGIVYYMQACFFDPCTPGSWFVLPPVTGYSNDPAYISLYFAIMVISTCGYGDITVRNIREVIFVTLFFHVGVMLFCYLISEYSAHLSLGREPRQTFVELADRVGLFLESNKMMSSERIRVRQYLNLQWEDNKGYEFCNQETVFYDTPPHLTFEISQNMRKKKFYSIELFKGLGENVLASLLYSSFRKSFPPHEVVIYAGEVCDKILYLENGYCELTYARDINIKKLIGPGEVFCAIETILGLTSMHHVRSLTNCVVMKIRKSDLRSSIALNPTAARELDLAINEFRKTQIVRDVRALRPIRLHLNVRPPLQKSLFRFKFFRKQKGNKELKQPYEQLGVCQCIRCAIFEKN